MPRRFAPLLATAALTALALTGCTSADGESTSDADTNSDTQTVAEACAQLETEMTSFSEGLGTAISELGDDPAAARDLLAQMSDQLDSAADELGNARVERGTRTMSRAVGEMADAMTAGIDDPDSEESAAALQESLDSVQAAGETMGEICG